MEMGCMYFLYAFLSLSLLIEPQLVRSMAGHVVNANRCKNIRPRQSTDATTAAFPDVCHTCHTIRLEEGKLYAAGGVNRR